MNEKDIDNQCHKALITDEQAVAMKSKLRKQRLSRLLKKLPLYVNATDQSIRSMRGLAPQDGRISKSRHWLRVYIAKQSEQVWQITLLCNPYPSPKQCESDKQTGDIHPFSFIVDDSEIDPEFREYEKDGNKKIFTDFNKLLYTVNVNPATKGLLDTLKMKPADLQKAAGATDWRWERARLIAALGCLWA
jgi:hypothetical protein